MFNSPLITRNEGDLRLLNDDTVHSGLIRGAEWQDTDHSTRPEIWRLYLLLSVGGSRQLYDPEAMSDKHRVQITPHNWCQTKKSLWCFLLLWVCYFSIIYTWTQDFKDMHTTVIIHLFTCLCWLVFIQGSPAVCQKNLTASQEQCQHSNCFVWESKERQAPREQRGGARRWQWPRAEWHAWGQMRVGNVALSNGRRK